MLAYAFLNELFNVLKKSILFHVKVCVWGYVELLKRKRVTI